MFNRRTLAKRSFYAFLGRFITMPSESEGSTSLFCLHQDSNVGTAFLGLPSICTSYSRTFERILSARCRLRGYNEVYWPLYAPSYIAIWLSDKYHRGGHCWQARNSWLRYQQLEKVESCRWYLWPQLCPVNSGWSPCSKSCLREVRSIIGQYPSEFIHQFQASSMKLPVRPPSNL